MCQMFFFLILIGKYDKAVLIKNLAVKQENYFVLKKHHAKFPRSWVKKIYLALILRGRIAVPQRYTLEKLFYLFIFVFLMHGR